MLIELAAVVFIASIFIFFSQEFISGFKRILAIKGANLVLPLAFASWLVFTFEYWALWSIFWYREIVQNIVSFLAGYMPFQSIAYPVVLIVFLTLISVGPVLLIDWILWKKTYKHYPHPYLTSTLIWVATAIIVTTT